MNHIMFGLTKTQHQTVHVGFWFHNGIMVSLWLLLRTHTYSYFIIIGLILVLLSLSPPALSPCRIEAMVMKPCWTNLPKHQGHELRRLCRGDGGPGDAGRWVFRIHMRWDDLLSLSYHVRIYDYRGFLLIWEVFQINGCEYSIFVPHLSRKTKMRAVKTIVVLMSGRG